MRSAPEHILWLVVSLWLLKPTALNAQKINLNWQTTIHIIYKDVPKITPVTAQVYHVFPAYDYSEASDSLSIGNGQIWLRLPVRTTQDGNLLIESDEIKCMLVPGDTIHLHITPSMTGTAKFRYAYEGHLTSVQTYYLAKKEHFPDNLGQQGMNAGVNAPNLIEFKQQLDSLTQMENRFWEQYRQRHKLPAWFVRFESDAIRYNDAMFRLYMTWYQTDYQKKRQTIPPGYFRFLDQLPVRNSQAQYDYAYQNFLREYVVWKAKSSKVKKGDKFIDKIVNQLLGNDSGGFFRLWTISSGVKDNPEVARDELARNVFPPQYQYLVSYLRQRSEMMQTFLKPGDKAPGFFLTDSRDSLVSLNQFKGQTVYLCFWFATCGACRKEFPYENQLVDQFKGEPVKIVSICVATKPDKWRQMIRNADMKTINLFANETWHKTLTQKYAVSVYPHYVLIGPDGNIIENFATRPSQNAALKIKAAIARAER